MIKLKWKSKLVEETNVSSTDNLPDTSNFNYMGATFDNVDQYYS